MLWVEQQHRVAISDQHADHDTGLVGDDGVAFDGQKVRQIVVRLVDDQHVATMHLIDGQQLVGLQVKGPGQGRAVAFDIVTGVLGMVGQVQRVIGRPTDAAVAGTESGLELVLGRPGGLQIADLALSYHFHR